MNKDIFFEDGKKILMSNLPWKELYGKSILVTGATGMIASAFVDVLLILNSELSEENKIKIYLNFRNVEIFIQRFSMHSNLNETNNLICDVQNINLMDIDLDFIIHAASFASPKYYGISPVDVVMPNVSGTINLFEQVRKKNLNTKILFISSSEVYGDFGGSENITEDRFGVLDPFMVRSCYAESKRAGEVIVKSYNVQYGIRASVIRPFHTYGPGMKLDDGRVFADFVRCAVLGEDIVLNSNGTAVRAFCYLRDAIEAIYTVLLKDNDSRVFNLGNPDQVHSIYELARIVESVANSENVKVRINCSQSSQNNYLQSTVKFNIPNIDKLMGLGWRTSVSVFEGFERTIRSFK